MTIFASFMGPAEVATWGILGEIWDAIHNLIDGLSDAAEVRCAFLLGNGQPERSKIAAYKALFLVFFASMLLTSILFFAGDDLPTWLTNDPALQHLLQQVLPLFGIGNFVMSIDTMAWTLLGSQGRYRLATIIVAVSSWVRLAGK